MSNGPVISYVEPVVSCYAGDTDFTELLELFADRLAIIREGFETALASGDQAALVKYAHQLKGSAGGYGFPALGAAAGRLEQAAVDGADANVHDAWSELSLELQRVEAGFAQGPGNSRAGSV